METCISFSGGRSSGYMLWRFLQANSGLPADALVIFANTGKEHPATLDFISDCAERWAIPITWIEYRAGGYELVDYATASRDGEPFEAIIRQRGYLPNPVARFCTVELKILPVERYLKSLGWKEWDNLIGVRADEPRRVAKMRADPKGSRAGGSRVMPLADAGITAADVGEFWRNNQFDLALPNNGGKTVHGNCDLCFLKPSAQILSLVRESPERAIWWADMEGGIVDPKIKNGNRFRTDRPSYGQMVDFAAAQGEILGYNEEMAGCFCGD